MANKLMIYGQDRAGQPAKIIGTKDALMQLSAALNRQASALPMAGAPAPNPFPAATEYSEFEANDGDLYEVVVRGVDDVKFQKLTRPYTD